MLEVQRDHFTRHGQHLNNKGKKLVSDELSRLVKQCLKKGKPTPIQMQWMEAKPDFQNKTVKNHKPILDGDSLSLINDLTDPSRNGNNLPLNLEQEIHVKEVGRAQIGRISSRKNKSTITRNKDFLW
jgi:hypothetical protein